jgi:hypothetical protein
MFVKMFEQLQLQREQQDHSLAQQLAVDARSCSISPNLMFKLLGMGSDPSLSFRQTNAKWRLALDPNNNWIMISVTVQISTNLLVPTVPISLVTMSSNGFIIIIHTLKSIRYHPLLNPSSQHFNLLV